MKNPKHSRTQGYTPSKRIPSGYASAGSKGKNNYSGTNQYSSRTPKVRAMPTGDKDTTYGYIYRNN